MDIQVVIFKQKFTDEDKVFLEKILLAADIIKYSLINSYYYDVNIISNNFYITFGTTASDLTHTNTKIVFPTLDHLIDKKENKQYREEAFRLLEVLKIRLQVSKVTDIKSLPINSIEELLKINKYAQENNLDKIELIDSNNTKIVILFNSKDKVIGKYILFSELIAIKLAMEIFSIKNIG